MVTTLYLIRHGETEGAEVRRYKGSIDVPLSEKGIRQMEQLAKYIVQDCSNPPLPPFSKGGQGKLLTAVYCSDLSRALKSAEIVAAPHGLAPVVTSALRERNFGIWEGMSFDEIREKYPAEFESWANDPMKYSPVNGESTSAMAERVMRALEKILGDHKGDTIAIVAHGGVNRIILCNVLGIPLENIFRIEQDYGALNIIEFWDKYPVVKLINGRAFLNGLSIQ